MSARRVLPMLSIIFALAPLGAAGASDAELSRALNSARCVPDRVEAAGKDRGIDIYHVRCVGNPPRSVGVFCARNACSVSFGNPAKTLPADREAARFTFHEGWSEG